MKKINFQKINLGEKADLLKEHLTGSYKIIAKQGQFSLFVPGLVVVALGLGVVLAPGFFIALIATFFLTIGILLCYAAWRFVQIKKKWESLRKDFQGRVIIHGVQLRDGQFSADDKLEDLQVDGVEVSDTTIVEPIESKKIIYH